MRSLQVGILWGLTVFAAVELDAKHTFFVSPEGDDRWSGQYAAPHGEKADGPFATVQRAQEAVRTVNGNPDQSQWTVQVWLREGVYTVDEPLTFGPADGGIEAAPVHWRAFPGETVVLSGGRQVGGFRPLVETDVGERISEAVREHVWVADLRGQGIDDFGGIRRRGFQIPYEPSALQLYYRDEPMTLARYPNEGWVHIAGVPHEGEALQHEGHPSDRRDGVVPTGRHYGSIRYSGGRLDRWASYEDVWMHGYWTWDWADSTQRVAGVDPSRQRIDIAEPHHHYGYTEGQRYYYFNIPEELDRPGEWYLDRSEGLLYFWPPDGEDFSRQVTVSLLEDNLIEVTGSAHLVFSGLELAFARGHAFVITDAQHVHLEDLYFHCLGGRPVTIQGGQHCGVSDSVFTRLDTGAIQIDGGNRATLERGRHYAVNNHIHDFGIVFRTYHPAVRIDGVGHRVAHNRIHKAPHMAISFQGNDHLIEYNEVFDIARETGDVGAVYTGRDYSSRGTMIRHNFFHNLHGPGLHGVRAVYLDDFASGINVYGNVFYRAGRAAFVGGGRDNRIQNNVFIDCEPSVQIDGRGLSWAAHHLDVDHPDFDPSLRKRARAARIDEAPYADRYPELRTLFEDAPKVPKGNVIENNLSSDGVFLDLFDGVDFSVVRVRSNHIADAVPLRMSEGTDQDPAFWIFRAGEADTRKKLVGNSLAEENAMPYQVRDGRIRFVREALPEEVGFVPIPLDKIGLQECIRHSKAVDSPF